jgi:DNA repair protein RadA/Sms
VNVAGGIRLEEPAADLALALALASSFRDRALPPDRVALGEVGLGGELRPVPHLARRLAEAGRLGFKSAVVPKRSLEEKAPEGMTLIPCGTLAEAIERTLAAAD